jgi:hypothetical protein
VEAVPIVPSPPSCAPHGSPTHDFNISPLPCAPHGGPTHAFIYGFAAVLAGVYNQPSLVAYGSGLTSDGEFAVHLTNQNILAGCYTPPPALPAGTTGPVFGQSASCHLFRRWPLDFGTTQEELPPVHLHSTNVLPFPCSPPGTRRRAAHEVVYTDGSNQNPGRAGAGIFFPKSSDSKLRTSHSLPVEGALLKAAPVNSAWAGYTFIGVQNSLRGEIVGLLQATREASDNARLAAHTDCLTALHLLRRYWHAPHTKANHHELTLVKALADAFFLFCFFIQTDY